MIARAPGKVVLSGAYAVLQGAPAIIASVDRYVTADTSRPAERTTPELREAFGGESTPHFDASELRDGGNKLGLGSSAAIVVACLALREKLRQPSLDPLGLRDIVFPLALNAHRKAQSGGSGIDVAASTFGGIMRATPRGEALEVSTLELPEGLHIHLWATRTPASTEGLLSEVSKLEATSPTKHQQLMEAQAKASRAAVVAAQSGDLEGFVAALDAQAVALGQLGLAAGANIVTSSMTVLRAAAKQQAATVLPSGAGGGDLVLYAGATAPSAALLALVLKLGLKPLSLTLGVDGVSTH